MGLEPDPALAGFLRDRLGERVQVRETTLEDADLEDDFDLAAAASSFHWVDEDVGLARIRDALRPGGWVALWWTAFGDGNRPDPVPRRDGPAHGGPAARPAAEVKDRRPFAHDAENRISALERAGFAEILVRRIEWWHTWDTDGIRGLFGSFSSTLSLEPHKRDAFLDSIAEIAERDFGGR